MGLLLVGLLVLPLVSGAFQPLPKNVSLIIKACNNLDEGLCQVWRWSRRVGFAATLPNTVECDALGAGACRPCQRALFALVASEKRTALHRL